MRITKELLKDAVGRYQYAISLHGYKYKLELQPGSKKYGTMYRMILIEDNARRVVDLPGFIGGDLGWTAREAYDRLQTAAAMARHLKSWH